MLGRWRKNKTDGKSSATLADLAGAGAALGACKTDGDDVFRAIFDQVALGIWQSTPEGRYIRVNPACAALMGFDTPEAAVAGIADIAAEIYVDPAARLRFTETLAGDGKVAGFVAEHRRRDGSTYWARLSAVAVRGGDGRPDFYIGSVEDVTELIATQEQLAAAERDYREIWENVAEGIYRSTPDGRQLRANPALVRLNGYDSEDEMLRAINDIGREWYVDAGRRVEFRRLLQDGGRIENFESEVYRHRTRERIWVSENAWEVRDEAGALLYYEGTVREITARKQAEARLRESEERFRDFAEISSDWYWETDADHVVTYISDAIAKVRAAPADIVGRKRHSLAIAPEEDPERWRRHLEAMDRREPFRDFVYKIPGADGQVQSIAVSGKPIFAPDGSFRGYRGNGRLITEQVRQQALLQASEERFRDFADTASDWYWETDRDHIVTYVSETASMLRGSRRRNAIGKHRWDMAADLETEPEKWAGFRATLERHEPFRDFKYQIRVSSGEIHHVAVSGKPVLGPGGEFHGYRGSSRVITEQVRQREALLASEGRFRDFAATASDWFWESDADHRFTSFTSSVRIGPGDPVDGVGRTRWEIALDVEDQPTKWRRHREVLDRHEPFRDFVHRLRTADGEINDVAVSGMPVFDESGVFRGYRGSARIITDAIRQEERLKEAKAHAEAASATKSTFLANMSHELRTPLNAIIGFSEIMDRQMFGRVGVPRYQDYIRDIRDSAQHLLRLIEDILDLSKAEAGKMEIDETDIDLGGSIRSACLMLRERAMRGGVTLQEEVPAELPSFRGDRRRIRQVLLNLVSNAVKFTPKGGAVVVSAASNAAGGLELRVSDTGIGISADDLQRVFEPFVQIGRAKELSGEGTGLGLPLCKELVELHGGTIALESEVGRGTIVTASFPPERTVAKRVAA
ncbi:MAG: PAS domain S-box protein [Rhodospirillaceae bacterium]|nr:PAS domain S-box protein [Rhodospirillaceae bacterium]